MFMTDKITTSFSKKIGAGAKTGGGGVNPVSGTVFYS
jgi:hypothetical protein